MTMSPREAMVLSLVVPAEAEVADDDRDRLADQFRMKPERITAMIDRIFGEVRSAGSTLDTCQPRGATRCRHCGGILP